MTLARLSRYIAANYCEGSLLADRFRVLKAKPANAAGWRLVVATLALIAFAFQSYVTQTHIHFAPRLSAAATFTGALASKVSGKLAQRDAPKNAPDNDESPKCPLCQAVNYAGHFVTPAQAALLLPAAAISISPLAAVILSPRESPSHIWQGRGPPNS